MAMFENEGFCPYNSFLRYQNPPEIWSRTEEILGSRAGYMVYTKAGSAYEGNYVVDCLVGSTSTLGIEIACKLKALIPECEYAKTGRKILITDVINPFQMPGISSSYVNNVEHFIGSSELFVLEDNRYVVGITDDETVHMYIFKK